LIGSPLTGVGVGLGFTPFSVVAGDDCDESVFFFLIAFFCAESTPSEDGTVVAL